MILDNSQNDTLGTITPGMILPKWYDSDRYSEWYLVRYSDLRILSYIVLCVLFHTFCVSFWWGKCFNCIIMPYFLNIGLRGRQSLLAAKKQFWPASGGYTICFGQFYLLRYTVKLGAKGIFILEYVSSYTSKKKIEGMLLRLFELTFTYCIKRVISNEEKRRRRKKQK